VKIRTWSNWSCCPASTARGLLFRPLVATLSGVETKVVSYPNDKALSLDEHARWVIRQLPGDKAVLLVESFSGLVALRVFRGRFERFQLERIDGPHFLLQAKPRECAQRISEFSARIGV
jgi:surfactin synthase thioesterase subunit